MSGTQLALSLPDGAAATTRVDARRLGAVYTPDVLSRWVAAQLLARLSSRPRRPLVLDPACGDGALLAAVRARAGGAVDLAGFDVDPEAVKASRKRLGEDPLLECADSLFDPVDRLLPRPPDAVIANPPWGAQLAGDRTALSALGYELAHGQFDSYELFIERCLRLISPGGLLAFIIPDSIFLPEHEAARRLLVERSTMQLVARLGEGFFEGVFRGTAVMVFAAGQPRRGHRVGCLRLPPDVRRDILSGRTTLDKAQGSLIHRVAQERFRQHPHCSFDIDVRDEDLPRIERFNVEPLPWSRWLTVGRGVELGKGGDVLQCPRCATARPVPRTDQARCAGCGLDLPSAGASITSIIRSPVDGPSDGRWHPLIVGVDVDRYRALPSREIKLGLGGINYKDPSDFSQRKLLVRKTGVGLKAAIDESGAYTTQVVFHFLAKTDAPPFILDYLLGVLCSRVMLAYHLRRSGETQWRSHPYVTPTTLLALPVPDLGPEGNATWRQAQAIAEAVRQRPSGALPSDPGDVLIDRLVAGLLGLESEDCQWVLEVLEQAQALEPIATLRLPDRSLLDPLRVA